jgi:mycothiol synthase
MIAQPMVSGLVVKQFHPNEAPEAAYRQVLAFDNKMKTEWLPEDPPDSLEAAVRARQSISPSTHMSEWHGFHGSEVIASAIFNFRRSSDNQHVAWFNIQVVPEMRRQGVARALLPLISEVAENEGRSLLMTSTTSVVPAGEEFLNRIGGQIGIANYLNQLEIADLNLDAIRAWLEHASTLEPEFELGLWEGPYPDSDLEAIAKMSEVMNTAPRGDLEMEDHQVTPADIRDAEASLQQRRIERWVIYVRNKHSGELAGYTAVFWNPEQPHILDQGDTGVLPTFRGRGLGRWLKGAMLDRVVRERPQVERVRTGNAQSNEPMLNINFELGFKPYRSTLAWQVSLDRVKEYLSSA